MYCFTAKKLGAFIPCLSQAAQSSLTFYAILQDQVASLPYYLQHACALIFKTKITRTAQTDLILHPNLFPWTLMS